MSEIKIFLASSSELKEDRKEFEIFINRQNKKFRERDIFLHLEQWEDFIDAMSSEGLQSEYNKAVKDSDIFVLLACNKVGPHTEKEFEAAFGQFSENSRPLIYTYFKPHTTRDREELRSLWDFEGKLKELKHYKTEYRNIEELKLKFGEQLNKLIAKKNEISDSTRTADEVIRNHKIDRLTKAHSVTKQQWRNYVAIHGISQHVSFILQDRQVSFGIAEPDDTDRQEIFLGQGFRLLYDFPFSGNALLMQNVGPLWVSTRLKKCKDETLSLEEKAIQERFLSVSTGHYLIPTSDRPYLKEKTDLGLHSFVLILSKKPFSSRIKTIISTDVSGLSDLSLSILLEYIESDSANIKLIVSECDIVR